MNLLEASLEVSVILDLIENPDPRFREDDKIPFRRKRRGIAAYAASLREINFGK